MADKLNPEYWNDRYTTDNTPWDIGQVSPPLKRYLDAHTQREDRILIPGAGRAYEAVYLHDSGYANVFVCDWAPGAFRNLNEKAPDFPKAHQLVGDFFELTGQFDLILEQTFFCAIDPGLRTDYVAKAFELLRPGGWIAGLLFNREFLFEGPPFGGTKAAYLPLFQAHFEVREMEVSEYSITPRLGSEVFFRAQKPKLI